MPGGDRTGPMGMGPMTGRAAGYCAGYAAPGYVNPAGGRGMGGGFGRGMGGGFGGGRGGGRGFRNRYYATGLTGWQRWGMAPAGAGPAASVSPADEREVLRNQADQLKATLESIQQRMDALDAESE